MAGSRVSFNEEALREAALNAGLDPDEFIESARLRRGGGSRKFNIYLEDEQAVALAQFIESEFGGVEAVRFDYANPSKTPLPWEEGYGQEQE